ncbi:MAG TPA: hypothetical protein VGO67_00295 [Verrucomicrobiae bacterium]|jgi:hypothetical protein
MSAHLFALGDPVELMGYLLIRGVAFLAIVAAFCALLLSAIRKFNTLNLITTMIALCAGVFSLWTMWKTRFAPIEAGVIFAGAISLWANIRREEGSFLSSKKKIARDVVPSTWKNQED